MKLFSKLLRKVSVIATAFLAAALSMNAQNMVTVSGQVIDETDQPIIGAAVMQQGTTNGVATDVDGNYSITAPAGSILVFSFIGYQDATHVVPSSNTTVTIKLQIDTEMLEETVVVGYGVQRKSDLTGAISQVKSDDIGTRTITNAEQALQGKTAGVQIFNTSAKPGSSGTIRIRGVSSNGSSDPLFVVDGNIANDISNIDPSDIESMEVLKDGASAAIYGARAGNGVILITTKRGQGDGRVSYSYQLTSQRIGRMPSLMNAQEYMQYYLEDGRFDQSKYDRDWDGKTDTDWVKETFEPSLMHHHTLNFQTGNEKGSLYVSLSYLDNNGTMKGDDDRYTRLTGMFNASWKFKPWLELTTNNQFSRYQVITFDDNNEYGTNPILSAMQLDPLTPVLYSADNLPQHMIDIINNPLYGELLGDGNGNYYGVSNFMLNSTVNPFISRAAGKTTRKGFNFNGSTALNITPIKGIVFTTRLGYNYRSNDSYGYVNDYYANANAHQNYGSVEASSGSPTYWQWENFVNWSHRFGKHDITAMAGTSYNERRTFTVSGSYYGSDGDFGFKYDDPRFFYFAYANGSANKTLTGGEEIFTRNLSYFGRVNWNYGRKYMLQVSLRADAADSSILPADNRWGYFPAVSGGWTISEEEFMQGTRNWLSFLKLRLSWGQNGSTASLSNYMYANVINSSGSYTTGLDPITYGAEYSPSSTGNYKLKWETSEQTNVGIDARFLSDKLSFSADYFRKETKDLIVSGIRPSNVVGVTVSPVNAGNVVNSGFEFETRWQHRIGDFSYSVSANFSTLKNKVTYVHESLSQIDGATYHQLGTVTRFEVGQPAWYFYGYKYLGVDPTTGDAIFEDTNKDGIVSNQDKTNIGSGIPTYNYGLTITADWKNFDLRIFGAGAGGNQIWCLLNRADYAVNKLTVFTADRWTPTHTNATQPRAGASNYAEYMISSAAVFKGDYFKIKQIQLGYNVPAKLLKKVKLQALRVYGSLDDWFTFSSYPGFDPEISGTGNSLGIDRGSYPNTKKLVFGVNVSF